MSEPSHRPPLSITLHDVRTGPPHEGERGEGVMLLTDRGNTPAILHAFPEAQHGVLWVCGARGGFGGPGQGTYARLAEGLRHKQIASLRMSYRYPNVLHECILDVLAGVTYLQHRGAAPVVLVGHSFGGAVVIAAGVVHPHVAGVVALAPQTYGAQMAGQLAPPSAGGAWESRHAAPIRLRGANLRLGPGAETARPLRGRRASPQ